MSIISLITKQGWLYAEWRLGPQRVDNRLGMVSRFLILRELKAEKAERVVSLLSLGGNYEFQEGWGPGSMTVYVSALAPHVFAQLLDSPDSLPMTDKKEIDLDKWWDSRKGVNAPLALLAEVLDGGRAAYRRLCREDVLRVLVSHYDECGPYKSLKPEGILASPLKRRYYDVNCVSETITRLLAEKKLDGTLNRDVWIFPDSYDLLHDEVQGIEQRALGLEDKGPSAGVFAPGEGFKAWQELRGIVQGARKYVWVEDQWLSSDVVALLGEDLPDGVSVRILGPVTPNRHWNGALASLRLLGREIPGRIEVRTSAQMHSRYIYVDDGVWLCGESFKDMTKKAATTIAQQTGDEAKKLCEDFERRWSDARRVYPEH